MSSGDWKTISSRCKTGFFQEIASNTQVSCNNSQALQPPAIGIPNFSIMLYTGPVVKTTFETLRETGVKNAFCNNTIDSNLCDLPCTVPCQASGGFPSVWQDWYVLDDLLVTATSLLDNGTYPQTVDTTGAVSMGIGFDGNSNIAVMKSMEGPYGSIDISFGIVPSHTHGISNESFYLPTPESLNDILNTDIRHYHPLPAIYLSTFSTETVIDDYDQSIGGLRFEAAAMNAPAVDENTQFYAANRQKTGPANKNVKPNNIYWGNGNAVEDNAGYGGGAHVYAMSSPEELYSTTNNGGGYDCSGYGLPPTPWPSAYTTNGVPEGTDASGVGFGMTDRNWCWNGTKWDPLNWGQDMAQYGNDHEYGIYFREATEDEPTGWIKDTSCVDITIDICGSTAVVDDIPTNLSDTNNNKFEYSSSEAVIDGTPDSNDISFPTNDEETTNLGYRTFGTFYIIYYPQIGTL